MQQDRTPDWERWRNTAEVKIWEAVALSVGIEPTSVKQERVGNVQWFKVSKEFDDRLDQASLAIAQPKTKLKPTAVALVAPFANTVNLSQFVKWAQSEAWVVSHEFAEIAGKVPAPSDTALESRERETLLNIIGALLCLMLSRPPERQPYNNQARIVAALLDRFPNRHGISQRNLDEKFAAATRSLNGT